MFACGLCSLVADVTSSALNHSLVGHYYSFNPALVPEAFQPFHQSFYAPRPNNLKRKGGCRSLQAEFKSSGSSHLMYRRCMHEISEAVASGDVPHILLRGPAGCGKSIALVALVEWARAQGW